MSLLILKETSYSKKLTKTIIAGGIAWFLVSWFATLVFLIYNFNNTQLSKDALVLIKTFMMVNTLIFLFIVFKISLALHNEDLVIQEYDWASKDKLEEMLENALKSQDYETTADIRDALKEIEEEK